MQEYKYQLQKDDYLDWIHWNVARQDMKKAKMISTLIFVGFSIFYIVSSVTSGKGMAAMLSSLVTLGLLGCMMFYMISARNRERMIWKRSGLKRLEKTNSFPKIILTIEKNGFTMEVPNQARNEFSYADISEIEETPRLFLLGTADQRWQFVAKTAFSDPSEAQQFKSMMLEKIEDAKAHPERYEKEEQEQLSADGAGDASKDDEIYLEESDGNVEPVDTSSMGKIGKMAHIMAALNSEEDVEKAASELRDGESEHKEEDCTDGDSDSGKE